MSNELKSQSLQYSYTKISLSLRVVTVWTYSVTKFLQDFFHNDGVIGIFCSLRAVVFTTISGLFLGSAIPSSLKVKRNQQYNHSADKQYSR